MSEVVTVTECISKHHCFSVRGLEIIKGESWMNKIFEVITDTITVCVHVIKTTWRIKSHYILFISVILVFSREGYIQPTRQTQNQHQVCVSSNKQLQITWKDGDNNCCCSVLQKHFNKMIWFRYQKWSPVRELSTSLQTWAAPTESSGGDLKWPRIKHLSHIQMFHKGSSTSSPLDILCCTFC